MILVWSLLPRLMLYFFFLLDYKYFRYLNIVVTFKFTNFESHLDM